MLCPSCGLLVAFLCLLVAFLVAFLVPFLCPSCAFLVALARGGSASQSCVFLLGSGRFQFISWRNHASELCFCSVWVLSGNILEKQGVREFLPEYIVPEGSLIKAIKGVFGLRVAPRLWYKKAKAVLEDAGWTQLASLPGVFVLGIGKVLKGILVLHVDDALHAGEG